MKDIPAPSRKPRALPPLRLIRAFLLSLLLPLTGLSHAAGAETPTLSAPEVAERVNAGDMILLDIRSRDEWRETGLAQGAWPVSMHEPDFGRKLVQILQQVPPERIALICATGGRTKFITGSLAQNGISGVTDLSEGMFGNGTAPGWIPRGLPVITLEEAQAAYTEAARGWE